jgi:hypothetical protein
VLLAVAVGVVWLLLAKGIGSIQLDAIRTGGTLLVGAGGVVALLLAARRQRSTELDLLQKYEVHELAERNVEATLAHQQRVAEATEQDATEKRITELYSKAGDQLGSDKAPVRLTGLYALERLAHSNDDYRQTIVNILCAYLRMPYAMPTDLPDNADKDSRVMHERQIQEREVRLTAQRILQTHLHFGVRDPARAVASFWDDIDLDLTGATLINLDLTDCRMRSVLFTGAHFAGYRARFINAEFDHGAGFHEAKFSNRARFNNAKFGNYAQFSKVTFAHDAQFNDASFGTNANFNEARFGHSARFNKAEFGDGARFDNAKVGQGADFSDAKFGGNAQFAGSQFGDNVKFSEAAFGANAVFKGATFGNNPTFQGVNFGFGVVLGEVQFASGWPDNLARFRLAQPPSTDI